MNDLQKKTENKSKSKLIVKQTISISIHKVFEVKSRKVKNVWTSRGGVLARGLRKVFQRFESQTRQMHG